MNDLHDILKNSNSISDIARAIFGKENYTNREKCKKILEENNIDWKQWLKSKEKHNYCLYCGKEILGPYRFQKKFCNHSCAAKNRRKPHKTCLECGKPITRKSIFCSATCYSEHLYKKYIEKWLLGLETGSQVTGNFCTYVKRYLLEINNYTCQTPGCNCNFINPYTGNSILQIHHIDGDYTNNSFENLQLLCPNCHAMTDNYGSRNKNSTRLDKRLKWVQEKITNSE